MHRLPWVVACTALWTATASAQWESASTQVRGVFETGYERIGSDNCLRTTSQLEITGPRGAVRLGPTLRWTDDRGAADHPSFLRTEDWDEPSDFARLVPVARLRWYTQRTDVRVHAGALRDVSWFPGVAAAHYTNALDPDHYQGGLAARIQTGPHKLDIMTPDVVAWPFAAVQTTLAPLGWFGANHPERLEVIGWALLDRGVPPRVAPEKSNGFATGGVGLGTRGGDPHRLEVQLVGAVGFGDGDMGVHGGLGMQRKSRTHTWRIEAAYTGAQTDYYPTPITPFYDRNRRFFARDPVTGAPLTFRETLRLLPDGDWHNGLQLDAQLRWHTGSHMALHYATGGKGRPSWAWASVRWDESPWYGVDAFIGLQTPQGADLTDQFIGGAAVWVTTFGPLRLVARLVRTWQRRDPDTVRPAWTGAAGIHVTVP